MENANQIPDHDGGIERIIELANSAANIRLEKLSTEGLGAGLPGSIPVIIDHRQSKGLESVKNLIEQYRTAPERRTGTAKVTTLVSFIDLVNRHQDEHSAIFAKTAWPPALQAVIDYHQLDGVARFGKHRVLYEFPVTEEHTNARGEKVEIPGVFMVSVPAFLDGAPVRIPARLRYRMKDGAVIWLRERVKADMDRAGIETQLAAYEGSPEA